MISDVRSSHNKWTALAMRKIGEPTPKLSGSLQRNDFAQHAELFALDPEIETGLKIRPERVGQPEVRRRSQGCVGGDRALAEHNLTPLRALPRIRYLAQSRALPIRLPAKQRVQKWQMRLN